LGRGRVYVFEKEDESVDWVQRGEAVWAEAVHVSGRSNVLRSSLEKGLVR
jgi:hypothetical protein